MEVARDGGHDWLGRVLGVYVSKILPGERSKSLVLAKEKRSSENPG